MTNLQGSEAQRQRDARELGRFGYAQELFRTIGGFSNFALSFSIISILTGAVTLYQHGLTMGGPAEMAFGWPLVAMFTMTVALSMAEWILLLARKRRNCWGWWFAKACFRWRWASPSESFCRFCLRRFSPLCSSGSGLPMRQLTLPAPCCFRPRR